MREIFKPRENMTKKGRVWRCLDDHNHHICDGGPSIIFVDGYWEFYIDNIGYHRLDGPATSDGEWLIHDKDVTEKIKKFAEENDIDLNSLIDEDKVIIALKFG